MMRPVVLGKEIRAWDWTFIPVIRKSIFCEGDAGAGSASPLGLIGMQGDSALFIPLMENVRWKAIENELNR
jgi:hypothetical protein